MQEERQSSSGLEFKLHPLVLINISDHFTRTKANSGAAAPRVLGCLLGQQQGRVVDIVNSFEMRADTSGPVPVIDQAFLVKKQEQYKQVFPKQDVVGWYTAASSGGLDIRESDLAVHRRVAETNESPVALVLDASIDPLRKELPVALYESELRVLGGSGNGGSGADGGGGGGGGGGATDVWVRANYSVATSDAERIGVDQVAVILPSGKSSGSEQLSSHLVSTHSAVKMLAARLRALLGVAQQMADGSRPVDQGLMRRIASLVAALPAMEGAEFNKQRFTEHNDALLALHLASLTQGVALVNDIVDKHMVAFDKATRRAARGMMG